MNNDNHLIFENYVDGISRTKNALGGHIMSMVKHGIPSKEEFIKIRQELHDKVNEIKERGTPATEEEKVRGQEIIAKIKNYRSQHPNDPPPYEGEENAEMPTKQFISLKQHINKGPIQVNKASKELPYTHKYIHHLAKQDSREGQKDEEAESACVQDIANKHGVSLDVIQRQLEMGIKVETEHTDDFDVATKIATDHLNEDPHYYTKLAKMEGKGEDEEGELMQHMKQKGMIDSKATDDTGKFGRTREEEESRIDPKCWKGYHKAGTKLKDGVRVNNCVKN